MVLLKSLPSGLFLLKEIYESFFISVNLIWSIQRFELFPCRCWTKDTNFVIFEGKGKRRRYEILRSEK